MIIQKTKHLFIFILFLIACLNNDICKANDVSSELSNLGLTLLNQKPIDFELSTLDGVPRKLSDYRGKWIWLVFWATWCGPCQYELPTLEGLYQEFKDNNFLTLGVSVDQNNKIGVKKFVDNKNITFPNFLDKDSRVSNLYQASSIPTLYVISPDWKIVGVYRGANNWESEHVIQNLRKLVKHKQIEVNTQKVGETAQNKTAILPEDLAPPVIKLNVLKKKVHTGEKFKALVHVSWKGDSKKYLMKVPTLTLPEEIKQVGDVSSLSVARANGTGLVYNFLLKAHKEGSYQIGPAQISFQSRNTKSKEQFTRVQGHSIKVWTPYWKKYALFYVIGITVMGIMAGLINKYLKVKKRNNPQTENKGNLTEYEFEYENIRQIKIETSSNHYPIKLLELYLKILKINPGDAMGQVNKIGGIVENLKYAGKRLTSQEIDFYEKQVEKFFVIDNDE